MEALKTMVLFQNGSSIETAPGKLNKLPTYINLFIDPIQGVREVCTRGNKILRCCQIRLQYQKAFP